MTPEKAWEYIKSHIVPHPDWKGGLDADEIEAQQAVTPLACPTFEELCQRFDETNYIMSPTTRDSFAVVLATILSTRYKSGDPVWIYLIGPSGCGKTTLIMSAAGLAEHTFFMSKFTGIHSGVKGGGKNDPSLIKYFQDKTLIVKDWTTVLTLPPTVKDTVYSELRDFFDGESASYYKNRRVSEFKNVRFSMIACCTEIVRRDNFTSLGERFLQVEMLGKDHSRQKQIAITTKSANDELDAEDANKQSTYIDADTPRKQYTAGFLLDRMEWLENNKLPPMSKEIETRINAAADVISYIRSNVEREGQDQALVYRPSPEIGGRIAKQMVKLARCLAVILGKSDCDEEVYRIIKKVAMDTANSYSWEIAQNLLINRLGLTEKNIASNLAIHPTTVKRRLKDMQELGIVTTKNPKTGTVGRDPNLYTLSKHIRALMRKARF